MLDKRAPTADSFPLEKEHADIATVLARWTRALLQVPDPSSIQTALHPDFRGCVLSPKQTDVLRDDARLRITSVVFPLNSEPQRTFLNVLHLYLRDFTRLHVAEFQVTRINPISRGVSTQVRYDLVGEGLDFYREQRSGMWTLEWVKTADNYQITQWRASTETRSRAEHPWFSDVTQSAIGHNRSYTEQLSHGVDYWRTVLDGASHIDIYGHNGVAVGDAFGTGFDDLYVCQPAGLPNRLFRNRGDGTFDDVTEPSGLGILDNTACALFSDVLNRGYQDLIVVRASGPSLFLNDGKGNFTLKPGAFQFATAPQGTFTGAAIADYDRDGWLDIYFCLYVFYQGTDQYRYPTPYYDANNGPPNFLFRNNRDGTFADVTASSGMSQNNSRYSFCCSWTDVDGNGWPDLYVVNDFGRKNLYRNHGDGTFSDIAAQSGVEDIGAGMSIACCDYGNDGAEGLYVANMWTAAGERIAAQPEFQPNASAPAKLAYRKHAMGNSLLHNNGNGVFQDETVHAQTGMGRWSWSSDFWDFNHDGTADLYVTNGMVSGPITEDLNGFFWRQVVANSPDHAKPWQPYEDGWSAINELIRADYTWSGYERNVFYINNGDQTFTDVSGAVGLDLIEDGRAFALADLDNDGRLELILKSRNAPQIRILKNIAKGLPASLAFRLYGTKSNRDAIGATITVETKAARQTRRVQAGSGFLSQHSKTLLFGLGSHTGTVNATVRWPSGLVQEFGELPPGHRITIHEGRTKPDSEPFQPSLPFQETDQSLERLPEKKVQTWLLRPVAAPLIRTPSKPAALYLWDSRQSSIPHPAGDLLSLDVASSDDAAAIYNLLYRSLFDRHRDLSLPAVMLLNEQGEIVKLYQGEVDPAHLHADLQSIPRSDSERLARALPFPGHAVDYEPSRNHLSLGSLYFQYGYYEQAQTWFQLGLRDDSASAEAQYGLGSVALKQGKLAEAELRFHSAVDSRADYPDTKPNAWNNLGLIAAQTGRTDEAITNFNQALELSPDHIISLQNLGNAYRQQHRWDEAQQALGRAVRLAPADAEANYGLAMVFAQMDQPDQAYTYLKRALDARPGYPEAMNNLAVLYLRTKRLDEAISEFQVCIRTAPQFDQAYLNLARVYAIQGERQKARDTLMALLKEHPDHAQARKALQQLQ